MSLKRILLGYKDFRILSFIIRGFDDFKSRNISRLLDRLILNERNFLRKIIYTLFDMFIKENCDERFSRFFFFNKVEVTKKSSKFNSKVLLMFKFSVCDAPLYTKKKKKKCANELILFKFQIIYLFIYRTT